MKLYFKFFKMHTQSAFQYRLGTLFLFLSQILNVGISVVVIVFMFDKFGMLKGWTFEQILLLFGIIYSVFSFSEFAFRGLDQFSNLVRTGDLDRLFVRPLGILKQAIYSQLEISKLSRFISAIAVLIISLVLQPASFWIFSNVILLIFCLVSGTIIFLSLFMFTASFSIYSIEGLEIMNIFTDGGREFSQYPLTIYGNFIKTIFTYIIPLGCINYLPVLYMIGDTGATFWGNFMAPVYAMFFFVPAYLFFRFSLKRYKSSGS